MINSQLPFCAYLRFPFRFYRPFCTQIIRLSILDTNSTTEESRKNFRSVKSGFIHIYKTLTLLKYLFDLYQNLQSNRQKSSLHLL